MNAMHWNTLNALGAQALKQMDRNRQARGQSYDRAGFGPQESPSSLIHAEPGVELRRFGPPDAEGPPVLCVPAPIKRAYIWDLSPETSVVRRWVARGYRVYLAQWTPVSEAEQGHGFGLDDYAGRLLAACARAIEADSGHARAVVAGHSLGGILAALFSALYPERVRATILLEAPLHVEPSTCCFNRLVRATPDAADIAKLFGQVPGVFLNMMSAAAEPQAFQWERMLDRWLSLGDPQAMATHLRVERWTHDEFPMPGKLFTDIVESLYRNDAFMAGTLNVGGRSVGPADLHAPLISVADPRSKLIPLASVRRFHEATSSPARLLLEYEGDIGVNLQHVGVLVGRSAHARLWPAIFDWIEQHAPLQPNGTAALASPG